MGGGGGGGGRIDRSFSELFFNISRTNSKTSKVNQRSVLNLKIFNDFPKNLHRTNTFNSVTLKYTDRTSFFSPKQIIFRVGG